MNDKRWVFKVFGQQNMEMCENLANLIAKELDIDICVHLAGSDPIDVTPDPWWVPPPEG